MKNKTWVLVAAALVVYAAFTLLSGGKERQVVKTFEAHSAQMHQEIEDYLEHDITPLGVELNAKKIGIWKDGLMVEYTMETWGSTYYGVYFSLNDVPLAFQNTDAALTEESGVWTWTSEGDNHGRTYRLEPQWFYFEASF